MNLKIAKIVNLINEFNNLLKKRAFDEAWQEILNRFPQTLQEEILNERSGSEEDVEELKDWVLNSPEPISVKITDLLQHPANKRIIAMSPTEIVNQINSFYRTDIKPQQVLDKDPDRYERYSKMNPKTAKPSTMVNGMIYWGNGRFKAACLRGDETLNVWDISSESFR